VFLKLLELVLPQAVHCFAAVTALAFIVSSCMAGAALSMLFSVEALYTCCCHAVSCCVVLCSCR
jgi:hypothetical protein